MEGRRDGLYGRWTVSFRGTLSDEAESALAEWGIEKAGGSNGAEHPLTTTVAVRAADRDQAIAAVQEALSGHGPFEEFNGSRVLVPIRMNLLENAYDFLNESLLSTIRAEEEPRAWKFAVLEVVQAIELLLKARLQAEHRMLVYENIDIPKKTVSMRQAVERIQSAANVELTERERRSLRKALGWRDQIVHHEFELSAYEVESVYVELFEFLVRFHDEHTGFGSLHERIDQDLWEREAELFEFFNREFVTYRGAEVVKSFPAEIVRSQDEPTIDMHGEEWTRIRHGEEPGLEEDHGRPCHDCAVIAGEIHVLGCDWEVCPRCFGQLLGCGCAGTEGPPSASLRTREEAAKEIRRLLAGIDH
jgi:hypothetical protein